MAGVVAGNAEVLLWCQSVVLLGPTGPRFYYSGWTTTDTVDLGSPADDEQKLSAPYLRSVPAVASLMTMFGGDRSHIQQQLTGQAVTTGQRCYTGACWER